MVSMIAGTQELWSYVCAQAKLWLERFPLFISNIIYWWSEKKDSWGEECRKESSSIPEAHI